MKLSGLSRRYWVLGTLAALVLGLVFLIAAPATNRIGSGSTWSSAPDGYRAWYDYMAAEGASVERWQRPLDELLEDSTNADQELGAGDHSTLLVVLPQVLAGNRYAIIGDLSGWFEAGNQAVILSPSSVPVTAAPFSSKLPSDAGAVTIETRRRLLERNDEPENHQEESPLEPVLADEYGAVVWRQAREAGALIGTVTPFLAANAYADSPGNFAFLANLVQQSGGTIYVDEYVHGYKDSDVVVKEVAGSWVDYLVKTPLLLVAMQSGVLLLIGLLAQNRRFGLPKQIPPVEMNNSAAYIQALAGVLHKANNHDFLVETLTRAEQKTLQRALGLGDAPVSLDTLQTAWQQTTGRSVAELNVLRSAPKRSMKGESALRDWLKRLQSLHAAAGQRRAD